MIDIYTTNYDIKHSAQVTLNIQIIQVITDRGAKSYNIFQEIPNICETQLDAFPL